MTDLFTYAEQLRDRGIELAASAQEARTPGFGEQAYQAIVAIAKRSPVVHIDMLLTECTIRPKHPNAWASPWVRAIKNKIIERSGQYLPCTVDPAKRAHVYPVYKSLIYGRHD